MRRLALVLAGGAVVAVAGWALLALSLGVFGAALAGAAGLAGAGAFIAGAKPGQPEDIVPVATQEPLPEPEPEPGGGGPSAPAQDAAEAGGDAGEGGAQ